MGYEKIIFYDPVLPEYVCPQCNSVYMNAKSASCGHTLCSLCWVVLIDGSIGCPICKDSQSLEQKSIKDEAEIDLVIRNLRTWCNNEGCHEHIPLHERDKHFIECKHKDTSKKFAIIPNILDELDPAKTEIRTQEIKSKSRRVKKIVIRIAITLCLYGSLVALGILPQDIGLIDPSTAFCGVGDNGLFIPNI
jgi:hypothetical protein